MLSKGLLFSMISTGNVKNNLNERYTMMHKTITIKTRKRMGEISNSIRAEIRAKDIGTPNIRKVRRDVRKILKKIPKDF